ncbi:MAG: nitroreductase [Chloroflexi bacterium]|nr:nitroreductase [Chloroflexota bacterium]
MAGELQAASTPKRSAVCNTCTLRLVRLAYQRAPWFRLVREPLRLGMRTMAFWHRIDPDDYEVRTPSCQRCMRFYKVALKERSATFRLLNALANPLFDALLERIVSAEAVQEAKAYARTAMAGDRS